MDAKKETPKITDFSADLLSKVFNKIHPESQAQLLSPTRGRDQAIAEQSPSRRQAVAEPSPSSCVSNPLPLLEILNKLRI